MTTTTIELGTLRERNVLPDGKAHDFNRKKARMENATRVILRWGRKEIALLGVPFDKKALPKDDSFDAINNAYRFMELPGGKPKAGECFIANGYREAEEETGVHAMLLKQYLGIVYEHRVSRGASIRREISGIFAEAIPPVGEPSFTTNEKGLGLQLEWVPPEHALELVRASVARNYAEHFTKARDTLFLERYLEVMADNDGY